MSCPTSPTAPLVISAKPFDMSMSGPPPGLSLNIPPSDAKNIDLPPQSKRAVLPSLGIPPTPVLHPPAPTGSPTQQGTDTQFKALGRRGLTPNFGRLSSHWKLCEKRLLQGSRVLTRTFWSGHANSRQPG